MGNHEAAGVSSERRRSSCSSWWLGPFSHSRGHFYPLSLSGRRCIAVACVRPSVFLSVRKLCLVQICAGTTKFAPNMYPGILPTGIENGGHSPWPSRSFWPFWLRILGNFACPWNNLWWIWARITKLAWNMHLGDSLSGFWKMGVMDADLQGHLTILIHNSNKRLSASLLYTDLDRPWGGCYTCAFVDPRAFKWSNIMGNSVGIFRTKAF